MTDSSDQDIPSVEERDDICVRCCAKMGLKYYDLIYKDEVIFTAKGMQKPKFVEGVLNHFEWRNKDDNERKEIINKIIGKLNEKISFYKSNKITFNGSDVSIKDNNIIGFIDNCAMEEMISSLERLSSIISSEKKNLVPHLHIDTHR